MARREFRNILPDAEQDPHLVRAYFTVTAFGRTASLFDHSGTSERAVLSVSAVYQYRINWRACSGSAAHTKRCPPSAVTFTAGSGISFTKVSSRDFPL
jgi:hypothetical protein